MPTNFPLAPNQLWVNLFSNQQHKKILFIIHLQWLILSSAIASQGLFLERSLVYVLSTNWDNNLNFCLPPSVLLCTKWFTFHKIIQQICTLYDGFESFVRLSSCKILIDNYDGLGV